MKGVEKGRIVGKARLPRALDCPASIFYCVLRYRDPHELLSMESFTFQYMSSSRDWICEKLKNKVRYPAFWHRGFTSEKVSFQTTRGGLDNINSSYLYIMVFEGHPAKAEFLYVH